MTRPPPIDWQGMTTEEDVKISIRIRKATVLIECRDFVVK